VFASIALSWLYAYVDRFGNVHGAPPPEAGKRSELDDLQAETINPREAKNRTGIVILLGVRIRRNASAGAAP